MTGIKHTTADFPARKGRRTLLVISQTFVPDPAAVGQYIADVAYAMADRGWRVIVYTSRRGYDNPKNLYPPHEIIHGVEVRRLPLASFGKKSILIRVIGTASFMAQALVRGLFTPNVSGILFSTSPPLVGIIASIVKMFRRLPIAYWAMDLNPDQLIAMGKIQPDGLIAGVLESANRLILRNSDLVVALDRFMAQRLEQRVAMSEKLAVIPPWPHEDFIEPVRHDDNPFRQRHGLAGKFVVMYSGNHSPANPLDTLLEAAKRLKDDDRFRFLFVGGGIGKKHVEQFVQQHRIDNALCLPYQPLEDLRWSLSAADVHVVSLGSNMVGIIHPCKVYGAMAVGRPVLFFGPSPSHVSDLLDKYGIGYHVAHGDVDGAVQTLQHLADADPACLAKMGTTAQQVLQSRLSQDLLCGEFCDRLEAVLGGSKTQSATRHHQALTT